jgi:replication-associated recombination protein RarA
MTALTKKYQPRRIRDFAGLARAKAIMGKLVANPYPSAWLFTGDSGTGKTTLALAVGNELNAQVIHVPAADCTVDKVRWIRENTASMPMFGDWFLVLVDEADRMSPAAQVAFLSLLDATGFPSNTIFVFTRNESAKLEDRFLSRVKEIPFNGSIDAKEFGDLLYSVWFDEAPVHATAPLMHEIIAESGCNIRKALNDIEMELMMVPARRTA